MKLQSVNIFNLQNQTKGQNTTNNSQVFGCKYCRDMVDLFMQQRPDLSKSAVTEYVKIITSGKASQNSRFPFLHHGFLADRILLRLENSLEKVRSPKYFENHVKAIIKRQNANLPTMLTEESADASVLIDSILRERGVVDTDSFLKAVDKEINP